jgi:hypothetical protein
MISLRNCDSSPTCGIASEKICIGSATGLGEDPELADDAFVLVAVSDFTGLAVGRTAVAAGLVVGPTSGLLAAGVVVGLAVGLAVLAAGLAAGLVVGLAVLVTLVAARLVVGLGGVWSALDLKTATPAANAVKPAMVTATSDIVAADVLGRPLEEDFSAVPSVSRRSVGALGEALTLARALASSSAD